MRLPFLRPKPAAEPVRPRPARTETARGAAPDADSITAAARTRARQRLVGALVLLLIGIVGFPVLFETRPRPLPMDTPIELPRREAAAPSGPAAPASASAKAPQRPLSVTSLPADADLGTQAAATPPAQSVAEAPPAGPAAAPATASPATPSVVAPAPAPAPKPAASPAPVPASAPAPVFAPATAPAPKASAPTVVAAAPRPTDGARAAALLAGSASASAAAGPARFVVQAGAYTDAAALREARGKVEKLGLKTYTQVIENDSGKRTRLRLGPFDSREEADAAADKVRRAGLAANVLVL